MGFGLCFCSVARLFLLVKDFVFNSRKKLLQTTTTPFLSLSIRFALSKLNQVVPAASAAVDRLLRARRITAARAGIEGRAKAQKNAVRQTTVLYQKAVGVDGDVGRALVKVVCARGRGRRGREGGGAGARVKEGAQQREALSLISRLLFFLFYRH